MTLFVMTRVRALSIATVIWLLPVAGQNPVFQSEIRIVEVAIVAHDSKGEPVTDLTADDLRVFDNGAQQKILSFDKLWDAPLSADGLPIGLPPKRRTVILLDGLRQPSPGVIQDRDIQQSVSGMLKTIPQTADTIAIFALGDELRKLHDFSLLKFGLRGAMDGYEGEPIHVPAANWLRWRVKALIDMAHYLKDIPGEKNLLWVATGFPPPPDMQEVVPAIRELAAARVSLYPVCLISPLARVRAYDRVDGVRELAELTGGRAYYSGDSLAELLVAAMNDSREAYSLSYAPNNYQKDGSAHEVKLRTERKGLELRYRPAYFADSSAK
jgi:VWFA-related protein